MHLYSPKTVATETRGVATGGISVYIPPKSVYLNFLCGCFVSLTHLYHTQIEFLATPLTETLTPSHAHAHYTQKVAGSAFTV